MIVFPAEVVEASKRVKIVMECEDVQKAYPGSLMEWYPLYQKDTATILKWTVSEVDSWWNKIQAGP